MSACAYTFPEHNIYNWATSLVKSDAKTNALSIPIATINQMRLIDPLINRGKRAISFFSTRTCLGQSLLHRTRPLPLIRSKELLSNVDGGEKNLMKKMERIIESESWKLWFNGPLRYYIIIRCPDFILYFIPNIQIIFRLVTLGLSHSWSTFAARFGRLLLGTIVKTSITLNYNWYRSVKVRQKRTLPLFWTNNHFQSSPGMKYPSPSSLLLAG